MRNYTKMWLIPLLLGMIMVGCEKRDGITSLPNTTTPTVGSTNPVHLATGVSLNQKVTATFSEAMDSLTITTATFTLMQGTSFVSGTVTYTDAMATFSPASNLTPNTAYTATITTMAKNLAGTALADNYVWSFTTGTGAAVTLPTVSSTNPANAETGVALNQKISATFSKTMDATTITASTFILVQESTAISGFVSFSGATATFTPAINLMPNKVYIAMITTGVKDSAGYAMANNYVWSFTTGSSVVINPPTVISTDPVNAATGVALNKQVTATFSKTMNASMITTATFTLMQGTTFVSGTVSYVGAIATYIPSSNLAPYTTYTATITTGAKDLAGNALDTNYVWIFTTGAAVVINPPRVISTDPVDGETCVALDKHIHATFSEAMDSSTISKATFIVIKGTCYTCELTGTVSYTGTTATFVPTCLLEPNTTYTAMITTGAKDLAGKPLANDYVWSFSTCSIQYTVSLSSNPAAGGTTIGGGTYDSGSSVTITATPNTGYTFTNWTENGVVVTSSLSYQFIISGNRTFVANFSAVAPTQYTVTLSSSPAAGGTTSGGGAFNSGSSVTVIATPNTGYSFINWTENGIAVSTNASYQFIISGNRTLVANFIAIQFTVTLSSSPTAGGTTIGGGTYNSGSSVTVTATPNAGYTFTNWTENGVVVTSSLSYQFTISGNRTLVAHFTAVSPTQFTVIISSLPPAGGTTSGGGAFNSGSSVTVIATPSTGYAFINWTENGIAVSTNASYQFIISGNRTLVANFTAIQYTVTLSSSPAAGGTTSGGGAFNSGSSVTVIATPNAGYTFTNWTENGVVVTASISYQFTISGNRTLVAHFTAVAPTQYTVTLSSLPPAGGTTSGGGAFNSGSSVTVIATPNTGYTFINWTENGIAVSTNASYQFIISGNRTLVANFVELPKYTVTLSSLPADGGTTTGGGLFYSGSSVTVSATANQGRRFTKWTENGSSVSTNATYEFILIGNRTLVANFGQAGIGLGAAAGFAILSDQAITDIPTSAIVGDVGISPGARSSITGLTIPEVSGTIFAADDAAPVPANLIAAKSAAQGAFFDALSSSRGTPIGISGNLNGLTLVPGLYESGSSIEISPGGILYLDAQGDANAVFIIRSATSITTQSTSQVVLAGNAQQRNIFWVAGSAITLGTNSVMKGTMIASSSISLLTGARLDGRALIQGPAAGQVSLDQNTVIRP